VAFYSDTYKGIDAANGVDYAAQGLVVQGVMALYQKCAHLGCRVPFCQASQWFECPCHGSKYNKAGEYKLGPAPQGLWHFPISLDASGNLIIDTGNPLLGSPRGTDTIKEPPQGPFCVATA
jgi:cytochrome b6-f complex iron-sulfur subunit